MGDRALVVHLLRRATFGPTAAEVDAAAADGFDATVARLLDPPGTDPGAIGTPEPQLGSDPYAALGPSPARDKVLQAQQTGQQQLAMLGVLQKADARYHDRSNGAQLLDDLSRVVEPTHMGIAGGESAVGGRLAWIVLDREEQVRYCLFEAPAVEMRGAYHKR